MQIERWVWFFIYGSKETSRPGQLVYKLYLSLNKRRLQRFFLNSPEAYNK